MIQAAYLTEDQWFDLCLDVYRLLRDNHPATAIELLHSVGFGLDTLTPDEPDVHRPN